MIRYGLKLWSSNEKKLFSEAAALCQEKRIDFVELYSHPEQAFDPEKFSLLSPVPVTIHNTHSGGWHEFDLGEAERMMWRKTLALADFFHAGTIVIHPGQAEDKYFFQKNLEKIDDPRIVIENMAGIDLYGKNMYAHSLLALSELKKFYPICFDIEKAVKAACFQQIDYKDFIVQCLYELAPSYFHISGGDKDTSVDEHGNLWDATFDVGWVGERLEAYAAVRDISLVFETPKMGDGLENDIRNMEYFRCSYPQFAVKY